MGTDVILVIVIATALIFDFTNGFHDTANVVATGISTRAIEPHTAIAGAAVLNFAGAFLSLEVAATVAEGLVDAGAVTTTASRWRPGFVLTTAYCLCLYGGIAYVDRRRRGQTAAAVPFGVLAVLGATVFVAALVLGLVIMTSKG